MYKNLFQIFETYDPFNVDHNWSFISKVGCLGNLYLLNFVIDFYDFFVNWKRQSNPTKSCKGEFFFLTNSYYTYTYFYNCGDKHVPVIQRLFIVCTHVMFVKQYCLLHVQIVHKVYTWLWVIVSAKREK